MYDSIDRQAEREGLAITFMVVVTGARVDVPAIPGTSEFYFKRSRAKRAQPAKMAELSPTRADRARRQLARDDRARRLEVLSKLRGLPNDEAIKIARQLLAK